MYLLKAEGDGEWFVLAGFTDKKAAEAAKNLLLKVAGKNHFAYYAGELFFSDSLHIVFVREWQDNLVSQYDKEE